jgi:hypothetical protein
MGGTGMKQHQRHGRHSHRAATRNTTDIPGNQALVDTTDITVIKDIIVIQAVIDITLIKAMRETSKP